MTAVKFNVKAVVDDVTYILLSASAASIDNGVKTTIGATVKAADVDPNGNVIVAGAVAGFGDCIVTIPATSVLSLLDCDATSQFVPVTVMAPNVPLEV